MHPARRTTSPRSDKTTTRNIANGRQLAHVHCVYIGRSSTAYIQQTICAKRKLDAYHINEMLVHSPCLMNCIEHIYNYSRIYSRDNDDILEIISSSIARSRYLAGGRRVLHDDDVDPRRRQFDRSVCSVCCARSSRVFRSPSSALHRVCASLRRLRRVVFPGSGVSLSRSLNATTYLNAYVWRMEIVVQVFIV